MAESAVVRASEVLKSGYIGQGSVVEEFENKLKNFINTDWILSTNSGTSAEHLAYHLLKKPSTLNIKFHGDDVGTTIEWEGLDEGSEVLATPLTCTATNWPILANSLKLKWVDIDKDTLEIDFNDLRRKITPSTKLISVVHWGGYPVDLGELRKIQLETYDKFGFYPLIIEDCAHSFGSKYDGEVIGAHGNLCTFSFQAIKHVTSVDGGALIVPDQQLFKRGELIRWYGIDRKSNRKDFRCEADIIEWGFKFHMNDVCAAIGSENLGHFDYISAGFKRCDSYYRQHLQDVPGITLVQNNENQLRETNPWLFSILVENKRDFMKKMAEKGIVVSQVHERNDKHTCVSEFASFLPSLDEICKGLCCLPCGWWVEDEDLSFIVDTIKEGW